MISKWFLTLLLPLQEKIQKEEEADAQMDMQLAQNATHAKIVKDLSIEVIFQNKIFILMDMLISTETSFRYVYYSFRYVYYVMLCNCGLSRLKRLIGIWKN